MAIFPPETFAQTPTVFSSVCAETDPRKGSALLRDEVIRVSASKNQSPAMKEWAVLSWYEMAAFAAVRGRCCPGAAPLELPKIKQVEPIDAPLNALSSAVAAGKTSGPEVEAALKQFQKGFESVLRIGATGHFGRTRLPFGDGEEAIRRVIARLK